MSKGLASLFSRVISQRKYRRLISRGRKKRCNARNNPAELIAICGTIRIIFLLFLALLKRAIHERRASNYDVDVHRLIVLQMFPCPLRTKDIKG